MRVFTLVLPVEYARRPLKAIDRAGMLLLARAGRNAAVPVVLMIEAMVGKLEGAGHSLVYRDRKSWEIQKVVRQATRAQTPETSPIEPILTGCWASRFRIGWARGRT